MRVSPGILITSDNVEVARWLEGTIAPMGLLPPAPLTMDVQVVRAPQSDDIDERMPFCQPLVEIRSGPPQGDVRIRWLAGPARAVIAPGGHTAHVLLGTEALADRELLAQSFLVTVLIFLLRRAGWHHVHAAIARDPKGRDWLFAGNAQSGKSTTAALLAKSGWAVGSDDITFLARVGESVEAVSQRAPIALRPGGYALLGLSGGTSARGGRKMAFFPEELGGTWAPRVTPQVLVLPCIEGDVTRVAPVRPREALVELVRWSAWVALEPALAQEHLDLLNALARQARCFRVALAPDLFAGGDRLLELIP